MKPVQAATPLLYSEQRKFRLAYFVTHPIQYQAPLLRRIAAEPNIDLKVFFGSDLSVRGHLDKEFGVRFQWDTPLLEGYNYEFLPVLRHARDGEIPGFSRPLNCGIRKRLRDGNFDAIWVHGYNYLSNLLAIRAANSLQIPVLLRTESTLHDRPRSLAKLTVKRFFFDRLQPRIAAVLSIGDENAAYWKHYFGDRFPIFQFPYAVDNQFFQRQCAAASQTQKEFRTSLGLLPQRPVILFAAKLVPRKRCGDLLDAYLKLSRDGENQRFPYLLIVGDGEERAMLEARAREAQPGDVRFLGFRNQSELPRFYDLSSVFVLASVDEPWGLAVNEAMNAGRPVIVSDQVGCQKNLVHHGVNGFVVRAGDVVGLARCLQTVLENEQTSTQMGAESLRIVSGHSFEQDVAGLRQALHMLAPGFPATLPS